MKTRHMQLFILAMLLTSRLIAQGGTAVPFVGIHPAPHLNGMAGAFTALPTSDPFGQYFNAAQLACFARNNHVALQLYPQKTRWLPQFNFSDLTIQSSAMAFGFSTPNMLPGIPFSLGIGYIHTRLNYGRNIWTDESGNVLGVFESSESYQQYAVGFGLDWYIHFNLGFSLKNIKSNLHPGNVSSEQRQSTSTARTMDYGFLVTIPTLELLNLKPFQLAGIDDTQPFLNFSLGFSVHNIGNEMLYLGKNLPQPFPRTASMGYGLSTGLNANVQNVDLRIIQADWSAEARNLLIERDTDGAWDYVSFPGKIDLIDHVFLGKYDEAVTIYQGYRIQLFEFFEYSFGYFRGAGFDPYIKTRGFMLSSKGLFKFIAPEIKNETLQGILNRITLQYAQSRYFTTSRDNPLDDTSFRGLTISLHSLF